MDINAKFDAHAQSIAKQVPGIKTDVKERRRILGIFCKAEKKYAGDEKVFREKQILDNLDNALDQAKNFYENL